MVSSVPLRVASGDLLTQCCAGDSSRFRIQIPAETTNSPHTKKRKNLKLKKKLNKKKMMMKKTKKKKKKKKQKKKK
jgi:hypothetical protein